MMKQKKKNRWLLDLDDRHIQRFSLLLYLFENFHNGAYEKDKKEGKKERRKRDKERRKRKKGKLRGREGGRKRRKNCSENK